MYEKIEQVYNEGRGTYGSPRIYRVLKEKGVACSENRVARLMRLRGLRAKQERTFKTTTKRNKKHPVAPNLLDREFVATDPNEKWLSDITYIGTEEGWLYLAVVLDLFTLLGEAPRSLADARYDRTWLGMIGPGSRCRM